MIVNIKHVVTSFITFVALTLTYYITPIQRNVNSNPRIFVIKVTRISPIII